MVCASSRCSSLLQLLLLAALLLLYPSAARAAPVNGQVSVATSNGYARLVFTLSEETDAEVRLANGIVIIQFKQPVEISVDRIPIGAPNYVGAARRDPDGTGVRLALNRKVTVNSMAAGEKLFVDLLPEDWTGLPPGLPQDVVEELARRARDAEKKARQKLSAAQQRTLPAGARARRRAADLHALHLRAAADRSRSRPSAPTRR